jgi:cysteine desulfurase
VPLDGDLISISAHKIGGIHGAGALYIKNGVRVNPMFYGGGQQNGIRPGTESAALIAAFAEASKHKTTYDELYERLVLGLQMLGIKKLNSFTEDEDPHHRRNVPNIVNFSCGVKSEPMLHFLAEHGIYVSSGSACARGKKSAILPAYGVSDSDIDTAIRVSFGWHNTVAEVDRFIEVLEKGLNKWKSTK